MNIKVIKTNYNTKTEFNKNCSEVEQHLENKSFHKL